MASNKKITDLDEISSITVADDDVLAIVDVSQDKTYKIRKDAFEVAISGVTSMAASSPLSTNATTGSVVMTLGTVPVSKGGTGGITASEARDNIGLGSIATQDSTGISVTGGSLSGLTSVGTSALTATGTSTLSTVDINGGAIDGTAIGASTKSTGAFTTLNATGTSTLSTVDINAGNIDGTAIGSASPSSGAFTTLTASSGYTGNVTGNVSSSGTSTFNALSTTSLTLGGTAVTSTAAELNKLDGYVGSATELNYARDLYNTGVTSSEFDALDGFTGNSTHLNYAKSLYDTGVTTTEFDRLDGVNGTIWHNGNDVLSYVNSTKSSGYLTLPNGLRIVWGYYNGGSTSSTKTITFPIAFTYCFSCVCQVATAYNNPLNSPYFAVSNLTNTKFEKYTASFQPDLYYIAIGI